MSLKRSDQSPGRYVPQLERLIVARRVPTTAVTSALLEADFVSLGLRALDLPRWYDVDTPADLLRLRDDLERERRLARRLRPVDLDDPAARQAAQAEGHVEGDRPRGDHLDGRGHQLDGGPAHHRWLRRRRQQRGGFRDPRAQSAQYAALAG